MEPEEAIMARYEIVKWNVLLATRERGRRVREEIEQELARLSPGERLVSSFRGV